MKSKSIYRSTKRWLRKNYPLPFPCRTLVRHPSTMKGLHGQFCWHDGRAVLWVRANPNEEQMAETLIEEWVHAIRHAAPIAVDYDGEAHDATFWALYGQVVTRWRQELL